MLFLIREQRSQQVICIRNVVAFINSCFFNQVSLTRKLIYIYSHDLAGIMYHRLKGTLSPGFCSFFVITVLIIQLDTLFREQNVPFTVKARYQVNFQIDTKVSLVLSDFSKTRRYNLKTLAQLFQITIHFHPGHP